MAVAVAELTQIVPVVPARDVQLAVAWYCEKLGFAAVHVEAEYGIVQRGHLQIHFWGPSGVAPEDSQYMYRIGVDPIDELYASSRELGIVHPNAPLDEKPWGMREFSVIDRDGNLLTFFGGPEGTEPPEREFPNLSQVFGGYLHQDWDLDAKTPDDDALRLAREESLPGQMRAVLAEIDALLASDRDNRELSDLVDRMTAGYSPVHDGWQIRDWLAHARAILAGER